MFTMIQTPVIARQRQRLDYVRKANAERTGNSFKLFLASFVRVLT